MTKVSKTIRLPFDLNAQLDSICTRHGDVTWHIEQALLNYDPIRSLTNTKKAPEPSKTPATTKQFIPPTIQETQGYFAEKGCFDALGEANGFIDFYESKGWMVGKNKMKSWKASIRNWLKKSNNNSTRKPGTQSSAMNTLTDTSWASHLIEDNDNAIQR